MSIGHLLFLIGLILMVIGTGWLIVSIITLPKAKSKLIEQINKKYR